MSFSLLHAGGARVRALLAVVAAVAVLTACGGGGGGGDTPVASAAPAPATTTTTTTTTTTSTATPAPAPAPTPTPAPAPTIAAAANVLPITIDQGTDGSALNAPFVSVTVCQPGTQSCRTIEHILVDTGSFGLRVSAAALAGLSLPQVNTAAGNGYGECASFASGYTWGSVRSADIRLSGEQANAIPVQVYDDPSAAFAKVPTPCSSTGVPLDAAGSNGILGVGMQTRDCGPACVSSTAPGMYFSCTATACTAAVAPLASQVGNPVALLGSANNNGVAIVLPDIPLGGVPSVAGSLVLGIGTRDNNQLTGLGVFNADKYGNFSTTYNGSTSNSAFIDSGSNGIFFADTISRCSSGFYCPSSTLTLSASVSGTNGNSRVVSFTVENAGALPASTHAAHLGGSLGGSFDWGLPFFLGRTVFVAFSGMNTPAGVGPFWAF